MATPDDVLACAYAFAGQPYEFGAEVPASLDPDGVCPVDCSELVEAACRRAGVTISDGAYNQWKACEPIPVSEAVGIRGALLFYGDGVGTGRDAITHVAFSEGDGTTWEAWKDGLPVGSYGVDGRPWTFAGLIPGVDYDSTPILDYTEAEMLVITPDDNVALLAGSRLVWVRTSDTMASIERALGRPSARFDERTWEGMCAAYGDPS